jgi:hypothetical protein
MRKILVIPFLCFFASACTGNNWKLSDTAPASKLSNVNNGSKDISEFSGPKVLAPINSRGSDYDRIAEFVTNAEQRKKETLKTNDGGFSLEFIKTYTSAGNHLCKQIEISQFTRLRNPQSLKSVFCLLDERWEVFPPLRNQGERQEIFNFFKASYIDRKNHV